MTNLTETDLQELKDLINSQFEAINNRFDALSQDIRGLDKRLTVIETRLDEWKPSINKIADLAEKVGELKNWKQVSLIIITAVVSSILSGTIGSVIGWLIRGGNRI